LRVIAYFTAAAPAPSAGLGREGRKLPRFGHQEHSIARGQILGASRPDTVASQIELQRLPPGATFTDYEDQMIAPHIPLIRMSDRDPFFHKVKRLDIKAPSQRPFLSHWFVPTNAWITWKDLPLRLEEYFAPDPVWPEDDTELT
jgi:hypothetical protein